MLETLLNWHQFKHLQYAGNNTPSTSSHAQLLLLKNEILKPLSELGHISITYGFTSHTLLRYILKNSPGDMAPEIDQHASMELNSRGNRICKRDGAACDFYGKDRPIHITIGPQNTRYALIREKRSDGLRVNKKSAKGSATHTLFDNL